MKLFDISSPIFDGNVVYISKDGFVFSRPSKFYDTYVSKDGETLLEVKNFFVKHVHERDDILVLFGFWFYEESFIRKGAIIKVSKDFEVISKLKYDESIFSEFVWGDDRVVCSNSYNDSQEVFNGCLFSYNENGFKSIKIDPMLYGEYEFRGGIKTSEMNYLFFGVDKDNFRGFILESSQEEAYLYDVVINSDLWEIVGVSKFEENSFIFVGNEWVNYSKGFALIFENGTYSYLPINYSSSWFEALWVANIENEIFVSIFDFDSNQNCLLMFEGDRFEIIEKSEHSKFVYSGDRIFRISKPTLDLKKI